MFSKQDIEKYFFAEKQMAVAFIVVGFIALALALIFLLAVKSPFYKGAALPLLLIGLLQVAASTPLLKSSDENRVNAVYAYGLNPARLRNVELPRMKKMLTNFAWIKWLEIALIVVALTLVFYFHNRADKAFWYGFGLTLTIEAVMMFTADYAAERRAIQYIKVLEDRVGRR